MKIITACFTTALVLLSFTKAALADDGDIKVSLLNADYPASDLQYQGRTLNPAEAWKLKSENGLDLSTLEPDNTTDLWKGPSSAGDTSVDEALPIQNNDEVKFFGTNSSAGGKLKFNVITPLIRGSKTMTIMASRTLHTFLFRKELLRRLGYQVPAMKYLSQIQIKFSDIITRDLFLKAQVPHGTDAAATHWCKISPAVLDAEAAANKTKKTEDQTHIPCEALTADDGVPMDNGPLEILFRDVVAMDATPLYYNLALGPPIEVIPGTSNSLRAEGPRILRALAVPYSFANIEESINQTDWTAARVTGTDVLLNAPDRANFACSEDDALWILKKITQFSKSDFQTMLQNAFYPDEIAQVLTKKLMARRNSLVDAFGLKIQKLNLDDPIYLGNAVQKDKVIQQDWPGYASRFAYGDPESPLKGLHWYLISEAQSNLMETLMNKANLQIPALTAAAGANKHNQELYTQAYENFLKTGIIQDVNFGVWVAPIASGNVTISRSVIFGNYMGANNLVQLADTFGSSVNVGLIVGVDGLANFVGVQGMVQGTASFTLTHLKPLTDFKQGITEPLTREFVLWVFGKTASIFKSVSALKPTSPTSTDVQAEALKKELVDNLNKLSTFLGVGESFILSENLNAEETASVSVQAPIPVSPTASLKADANELVVSRVQFYRKDANTISVFKDNGTLAGLTLSFEIDIGKPVSFPVLMVSAKGVAGSAKSKIFSVDITPNPATNTNLYASAAALSLALKGGSLDALSAIQKPTVIALSYKDKASTFHLFHYQHRTLKTNAKIEVTLPSGSKGHYLNLTDGKQSGAHYQQLATQAGTFLLQTLTGNNTLGIDTQSALNPGQSFLGHSNTRTVEFQSRYDAGISEPYVRIQSRFEGWSIDRAAVIKITDDWSAKYGFKVYPDGYLNDTQSVKLYNIQISLHFYDVALKALTAMSAEEENRLENRYRLRAGCAGADAQVDQGQDNDQDASGEHIAGNECSLIRQFARAFKVYRRNLPSPEKQAVSVMKMVSTLEEFADFKDVVKAVGGPNNLYVASEINGFRIGSETISKPIESNSYGVSDPVNPTGVIDSIQNITGDGDGEFNMQWLRDVL